MKKQHIAFAALSTCALLVSGADMTLAKPVGITLPTETATLKKASGGGYQKTENNCGACHSLDYISTQPPGKGKDFWTAEVTKMINVYGAPIDEADRPAIIDYLASQY